MLSSGSDTYHHFSIKTDKEKFRNRTRSKKFGPVKNDLNEPNLNVKPFRKLFSRLEIRNAKDWKRSEKSEKSVFSRSRIEPVIRRSRARTKSSELFLEIVARSHFFRPDKNENFKLSRSERIENKVKWHRHITGKADRSGHLSWFYLLIVHRQDLRCSLYESSRYCCCCCCCYCCCGGK